MVINPAGIKLKWTRGANSPVRPVSAQSQKLNMKIVWLTNQRCWHEGADSGLARDLAECETNELMDGRCGSLDRPGGSQAGTPGMALFHGRL